MPVDFGFLTMPVGSPGMEVAGRKDPYSVMSFDKAGKQTVYEKH